MKARPVTNLANRAFDENDDPALPVTTAKGDFEIVADADTGQRWFWFMCPGPCGTVAPIALRPLAPKWAGQQSWEFDGNDLAPTLSPSINHVGCWHGWLRAGEFTVA